jgi:hypothetical protein
VFFVDDDVMLWWMLSNAVENEYDAELYIYIYIYVYMNLIMLVVELLMFSLI